jgi:peptidoglycan hydrolase CwlO-like protein
METSNYSYETHPPKKNSKGLVIGLLVAGLVIGIIFAFVNDNNHTSVQQTQQTQIAKATDEKGQVQKNFDDALVRLDSLSGLSTKMQGMLTDRQKDIAKMKFQIRSILHKEHMTQAEKVKADTLIAQMNTKISGMEQDVSRLTTDNQNLTQTNTGLVQDTTKLTQDIQTTTSSNDDLSKKVDIASTLVANNIKIVALHDKSNGQEKITDNAKKVNKLSVSFDVTNRIAATGQTDVFVVVTGPDSKIITPAAGGQTFTTRDEGAKAYTSKVSVDFETGKMKNVQFSWKPNGAFQPGTYLISIYHNGFKIGEQSKDLKKGGLFS